MGEGVRGQKIKNGTACTGGFVGRRLVIDFGDKFSLCRMQPDDTARGIGLKRFSQANFVE